MKRLLLAIVALLTLLVGFAQLQNVMPTPLQRLMDDLHSNERMMNAHRINDGYIPQYAPPRMVNGVEMVDAFIDIENKSAINALRKSGVIVNCEFDDFVTAQVPLSILDKVTEIRGVKGVEISKLIELCTDSTLSKTHAGQVLNGTEYGLPQAYDGSGVVIGIIDCGFDYQHIAFRKAEDTNVRRIVRVYDPENNTGHVVRIGDNVLPGSVFMGEQIDTLTTDDKSSHGTHTASIAAGMHVNGYGGMAPGAEIVLCSSRLLNVAIQETEVINCLKYIYSYADSVGKPCVVSVSVSTSSGPHDGNDRLSKAVANLTGPGRIFVIAAGNNASKKQYCSGWAKKNKPLNLLLGYYDQHGNWDVSYYYPKFWFDTWMKAKGVRPIVKFHILDKTTKHIVWESPMITVYQRIMASEFGDYFQPDTAVDSIGYVQALIANNSTGKYNLQCNVYNLKNRSYYNDSGIIRSRYQIGVTILAPSLLYTYQPDSCYLYSWMCNTGAQWSQFDSLVFVDQVNENGDTVTTSYPGLEFYAWPSDNSSIGSYAVHDSIISAGGYVGRNKYYSYYSGVFITQNVDVGERYNFSSYQAPGCGPTGRHLPTVTAPSSDVVAACSRFSEYMTIANRVLVAITSGYNGWGVMGGTSMAAPTVAGIIAEWLQINPNLSPSDVKNVIAQTAKKDYYTQEQYSGYKFGPNGKIDAMAGAQYILSQMQEDILLGDVTGDGLITVKDVSTLISYLLYEDTEINFVNSDLNEDGIITINDVSLLVSLLLSE